MKSLLLTLFIFTGFFTTAYTQSLEPMLDTTKRWTDLVFYDLKNQGPGFSETYKLSGKILIDTLEYFKLYKSEGDQSFQNWVLDGYMRETPDGKVYLIDYGQTQEYILFDFSLNVGDSLVVDENRTFIIDSIKVLSFAGKERKHTYFHIRQEPFWTVYWIEGVGSSIGFINSKCVGFVGGGWDFLCFEQNGELLYHNPANIDGCGPIEDCYYSTLPLNEWDNIIAAGNSWSDIEVTLDNGSAHYCTSSYKLGEETTLNDKIYYKLYQSSDSLQQNWLKIGYIGNYCYNFISLLNNYGQNEIILYHFPGNYNDTIDYGGNGIIITSHESKFFAGRYRWYWYGHTFPLNRPDTIIEGIGSISSGFLGVLNAGLENKNSHLLCFKENEQLLYHYPLNVPGYGAIEGCFFDNTDIGPVIAKNENFQIIPNPIELKGRIKTKENLKFPVMLEVFSLSGSKVMEVKIQKAEEEISFSTLTPGIFMCRLKLNNKVFISKVVVK